MAKRESPMNKPANNDSLADEVTPYSQYLNRRQLIRGGILAGSVLATGGTYRYFNQLADTGATTKGLNDIAESTLSREQQLAQGLTVDDPWTSERNVTTYNNFYEFTTKKDSVVTLAKDFKTDGWELEVDGLVDKPTTFTMNDLLSLGPIEERVYRMRCVEAWSMVIPWAGFPLARLLEHVAPTSTATHVAFETLYDPKRMPGQSSDVLPWPYVEGLTLAEAMNPLTLLATGLYRRELPPQDGAPIRLVVPWKYGFKGIKSIVKITLTDQQPAATWNVQSPIQYGFYANVNPNVDHPRWSQATEQRIGELGRRATLMFNGYSDQVAHLYEGMDLEANF